MSRVRSIFFGMVVGIVVANIFDQSKEGRFLLARSRATLQTLVEGVREAFRV